MGRQLQTTHHIIEDGPIFERKRILHEVRSFEVSDLSSHEFSFLEICEIELFDLGLLFVEVSDGFDIIDVNLDPLFESFWQVLVRLRSHVDSGDIIDVDQGALCRRFLLLLTFAQIFHIAFQFFLLFKRNFILSKGVMS